MSYVKPSNPVRLDEIRKVFGEYPPSGEILSSIEEKERMLAAIEECRWEIPIEDYTRAQHTILDVLQYLVEKT